VESLKEVALMNKIDRLEERIKELKAGVAEAIETLQGGSEDREYDALCALGDIC
jgi:hypothetical protein